MDYEPDGSYKDRMGVLPSSEVGKYLPPEELTKNNAPLVLGDVGPHFYAAASLYPTTPEEGESTNILVWPKETNGEKPVGLEDISNEDLWYLSEYSLQLLDTYPDSAVTYGISSDQRGITGQTRKALGTSVATFHFHNFINLRKDLLPSPAKAIYRSIREPFSYHVASLFQNYLEKHGVHFGDFKLVDLQEKNTVLDPYFNMGGIILTNRNTDVTDVQIAQFADALKHIHGVYNAFHNDVMNIFFSNVDEVKESNWTTPYTPRTQEEITRLLYESELSADRNQIEFLVKAAKRITQSDQDTLSADLKIFRSPTYSVGVAKNKDGHLCIAVNPHFYAQRAGGLQTLGIEVSERKRYEDISPYEVIQQRTQRAKTADSEIRQKMSPDKESGSHEEIIPLAGGVTILNNASKEYDADTEQLIQAEVDSIIQHKKATLPPGAAFYNGPAYFPKDVHIDEKGELVIEGTNWSSEGYFRHVALRDSQVLQDALNSRGIKAFGGLAVSVLVEVEHKDRKRQVILTKSGHTEYAPEGIAQMPGGSYQQDVDSIRMPDPSILVQQELLEEMSFYTDLVHLKPYAYITGKAGTNPTLIYKITISDDEYKALIEHNAHSEHLHKDADKAHEFVLYDVDKEIPEHSTRGAKAVLEVYKQLH